MQLRSRGKRTRSRLRHWHRSAAHGPASRCEWGVVAVDISAAMLAVARALPTPTGALIEWQEGDACGLDLLDEAFDLVLCQQGLQFFSDRASATREMRRVLVNGGRAVVSVWQPLHRHRILEAMFEATARHLGVPMTAIDVSFSLSNADELRALLSTGGFQRIEIAPRSLEIRLPFPDRFVQIIVLGAATSVPAFTQLDTETSSPSSTQSPTRLNPLCGDTAKVMS